MINEKVIKSIMDESLVYLTKAEKLQHIAHLLREHNNFEEENGIVSERRGRPKGSKNKPKED